MSPDITMCKGGGCTLKEDCYRFKATPSEYQSYFATPPGGYQGVPPSFETQWVCDYFWPLEVKIRTKKKGTKK